MSKFFPLAALISALAVAGPAWSVNSGTDTPLGATALQLTARAMDADRLYGGAITCSIQRDGTRVGEHRVTFERRGADLIATSRSEIVVKLAFIPVYHLEYDSRGVWRDGHLQSLTARTDQNGEVSTVDLDRNDDGTQTVSGSGGAWGPVEAPVFPTTHWNAGVLGADRVLNTITGKLNRVTMTHLGEDRLDTGAGPVTAHHFRYGGQLDTDTWFDDAGRWIKLAFAGSDGSRIEYLCDSPVREQTAARPR